MGAAVGAGGKECEAIIMTDGMRGDGVIASTAHKTVANLCLVSANNNDIVYAVLSGNP